MSAGAAGALAGGDAGPGLRRLDAAHRSGEAWALDALGIAYTRLGRLEEGGTHLRRALELRRELGDPRGPRFAAGITTVVLAITLLTGSVWLLAVQVAVFAIAAAWGVAASPYGWAYRTLVRPRLGPTGELEDPRPPRFAQTVGLVVTGVGLVLALDGVPWAVEVSAGLGLIAAFLNAFFGLCLGCELYLLLKRPRLA